MRPIRIIATPAVCGLLALAAVGCKAADALSTQEVVVHFAPGAPQSAHVAVWQTCGVVPHTSPEPLPKHEIPGANLTDVHFLVKPGSAANISRLSDCLAQDKFHGVVLGYDTPDM
jgi:hypothetical protein